MLLLPVSGRSREIRVAQLGAVPNLEASVSLETNRLTFQ